MAILRVIIIVLVILLGAAFAGLNADEVLFDYYFGQVTLPLSLALAAALFVGALCGVIASSLVIFQLRHDLSRIRQKARVAEAELKNLRKIPLKD